MSQYREIGLLKVQVFALTETHVNKDLDYGTLFEISGMDFRTKWLWWKGRSQNIHAKSLNLEEMKGKRLRELLSK